MYVNSSTKIAQNCILIFRCISGNPLPRAVSGRPNCAPVKNAHCALNGMNCNALFIKGSNFLRITGRRGTAVVSWAENSTLPSQFACTTPFCTTEHVWGEIFTSSKFVVTQSNLVCHNNFLDLKFMFLCRILSYVGRFVMQMLLIVQNKIWKVLSVLMSCVFVAPYLNKYLFYCVVVYTDR